MHDYLLCVMGSYVDKIYCCKDFPAEGDFTHAQFVTKAPGGCPLNVACIAASKGVKVKALDYLSDEDSTTEFMINAMNSYGVDTSPIQIGKATNGEVLLVTSNSQRTMFLIDPTRPKYVVDEKMQQLLNNSKYIYSLLHMIERSFDGLQALLIAKQNGAKVIIDGSSKYDDKKRAEVLLEIADGLFINHNDYDRLCRCVGADAKEILLSHNCEFICITEGSAGATLYTQQGTYHQDSFKLDEVVDSTGAGDSFAATFLAARLANKDYPQALRLASAGGAYACLKVGGQAGCCSFEKLEDFANSFKGE